jgi:hypothetical protein
MNKRVWSVLCLFASLLVLLGANTAKALELTVMTRNLYVGTTGKTLSLSRSELPIEVAAGSPSKIRITLSAWPPLRERSARSPTWSGCRSDVAPRVDAGGIFKADFLDTLLRDLALYELRV